MDELRVFCSFIIFWVAIRLFGRLRTVFVWTRFIFRASFGEWVGYVDFAFGF